MAQTTGIGYCDSTLNLMMGCDGCELWNPAAGELACYAGSMTAEFAGRPGWPLSFAEPRIFPERSQEAVSWRDLTGTDRPLKPWLNGYPRVIFLNDMGDTFTKSAGISGRYDWLASAIETLRKTPHIYLLLTKRASVMDKFWVDFGTPPSNFWLLASITDEATAGQRLKYLRRCHGAAVRGVSYEPARGPVDPIAFKGLDWVIFGGESLQDGQICRTCDLAWARIAREYCRLENIPFFMKQAGSAPWLGAKPLELLNHKGEDWLEFPQDLRVRQLPPYRSPQRGLFDPAPQAEAPRAA